ncbi:MAG: ankyrin repeat domain-containing protein [Gammaproteobacteria bacterium]
MKNQTFGISSQIEFSPGHSPQLVAASAASNYIKSQSLAFLSGSPARPMPCDGSFSLDSPQNQWSYLRYTEGPGDAAWMAEKNNSYGSPVDIEQLKKKNYGLSGEMAFVACWEAVSSYMENRSNGTNADNPPRFMPMDGKISLVGPKTKPNKGNKIRYDEGPGDHDWMKERDRKYIARLEREGTLKQLEPEVWQQRQVAVTTSSSTTTSSSSSSSQPPQVKKEEQIAAMATSSTATTTTRSTMKNQTFGLSSLRLDAVDITPLGQKWNNPRSEALDRGMLKRDEFLSFEWGTSFDGCIGYKENRLNGIEVDSPARPFPNDGIYTRYCYGLPVSGDYKVRYTEGHLDHAWMEERDCNYVARLEREGCLQTKENYVWTERQAAFTRAFQQLQQTALTTFDLTTIILRPSAQSGLSENLFSGMHLQLEELRQIFKTVQQNTSLRALQLGAAAGSLNLAAAMELADLVTARPNLTIQPRPQDLPVVRDILAQRAVEKAKEQEKIAKETVEHTWHERAEKERQEKEKLTKEVAERVEREKQMTKQIGELQGRIAKTEQEKTRYEQEKSATENVEKSGYKCFLSGKIMLEPVVAADGESYEREEITRWFTAHDNSPKTNAILPHKNVTPNNAMQRTIARFLSTHSELWTGEEVYSSENLRLALVQAVRDKKHADVGRILDLDKRFLTKNLTGTQNLLALALESSGEVLQVVLTGLGDRFDKLPEITKVECFRTAALKIGATGARLIATRLNWQAAALQEQFREAVDANNPQLAAVCLDLGANLEKTHASGRPYLHYLVENQRYEMLKLFIERGFDRNMPDNIGTALHLAVSKTDKKALTVLCKTVGTIKLEPDVKDNEGYSALHRAIKLPNPPGRVDCVTELLQAGANFELPTPPVPVKGQRRFLGMLSSKQPLTPLHYAFELECFDVIPALINIGVNLETPDNLGNTALLRAIKAKLPDLVQQMLCRVSNPGLLTATNKAGESALNIAGQSGEMADLIKRLNTKPATTSSVEPQIKEQKLLETLKTQHEEVMSKLTRVEKVGEEVKEDVQVAAAILNAGIGHVVQLESQLSPTYPASLSSGLGSLSVFANTNSTNTQAPTSSPNSSTTLPPIEHKN